MHTELPDWCWCSSNRLLTEAVNSRDIILLKVKNYVSDNTVLSRKCSHTRARAHTHTHTHTHMYKSRGISVGIASGYGLDDWGSGVRFPAGAGNFSHPHRVQINSGSRSAFHPMGTGVSSPCGKVARAWSWPLTSFQCRGPECVALYIHPHYVFMAWYLVKHRDNFTFIHLRAVYILRLLLS
jgi:hypothetical protein